MAQDAVIGFIGLGVMGGPMCANLARKGDNRVIGYDLNSEVVDQLDGVERAESAAALAAAVDIVFLSLPGEAEIRAAVSGPNGIATHLQPGTIIVDCSTAPVTMTQEIAEAVAQQDLHWIDAPVTRTAQAARDGTLSFMVGGGDKQIAQITPLLERMGEQINHCGQAGAGQLVKLMNNLMVARITHALAECLAVARESNLVDGETLFSAMATGSADSFVLRNHGLKFMAKDNHPIDSFRISYMLKDVNYAIAAAEACGVVMEGGYTNRKMLERADSMGFGERYHTVIAEAIERSKDS